MVYKVVNAVKKSNKKRYYPINFNASMRSDDNFLMIENIPNTHIKAQSPLTELDIGLLTNFVLDPMHMIYLGEKINKLLARR